MYFDVQDDTNSWPVGTQTPEAICARSTELLHLLARAVDLRPGATFLVLDDAVCAFRAIRVLFAPGFAAELLQFFDALRWVVNGTVFTEVELLFRIARCIWVLLQGLLGAVVAGCSIVSADELHAVFFEQCNALVPDWLRLLTTVTEPQFVLAGAIGLERVVDALEAVVAVCGVSAAILAVCLKFRKAFIDNWIRLRVPAGIAERELFFQCAAVCLLVLLEALLALRPVLLVFSAELPQLHDALVRDRARRGPWPPTAEDHGLALRAVVFVQVAERTLLALLQVAVWALLPRALELELALALRRVNESRADSHARDRGHDERKRQT